MRWTGSIVTVVLGVMAVLLPLQSVDAGVRAPFTEAGRRPLGPRVSSGGNTQFGIATCVVNADGTVRCWGNRAAITRQFPSGLNAAPFIPFTAPGSIEGVAGAVAVAVGDGHACALRHDGRVLCWGENGSGQLGLGSVTTQQSFAPTLVSNLSGVVGIAAGGSVTCAVLVDGTARCWGLNNAGQLGTLAASNPVPSPVQVLSQSGVPLSGLVGITTDGGHTCALAASSSVFCWGSNSSGEVDGTPTVDPQLAPKFVGDAVDVAAGRLYTCAVSANGTARCWGINSGGELGTGNTNRTSGQPQVVGLTGAVAIAGSFGHTCALLVNGSAACWGARASGQIDGVHVFNSIQPSPIPVPGTAGAVEIATGAAVSCAVLVNDGLRCWGFLGRETDGDPVFSIGTIAGLAPISGRGVTAGGAHSCARRAQGAAACWGENGFGQLGARFPVDQTAPVAANLAGASASTLAAGDNHSCARAGDGTARCWGNNGSGQAGDTAGGVRTTAVTVVDHFEFDFPTRSFLPVALFPVRGVATGRNHSCAVLGGGTAACWGSNASGQLGNGTQEAPPFPAIAVGVAGLSGAVAVTAGNAHSCALLGSGSVRCWGSNTFGQVTGTPTTTPQVTPVAPSLSPALPAVVAIAAGDFHTCALQSNGRIRCWGTNGSGRLGDGSVTDAVAVAPGGVHTCVVRAGGSAQCWGGNGSGQLGNGSFTASTAPVTVQQVAGLRIICCPIRSVPVLGTVTQLVAIEAGNTHTCAVRVDGQPLCWGGNGSGQVGDGSTANRNTAFPVPSFLFNVDPRVLLGRDGRVAEVTALVNCPAGQQVQVQVTLTQGESSGQGIGVGACSGGLDRYEVTVPANGRGTFIPGSALAEADAVIRDNGHVVDTQHWAREVEITSGQHAGPGVRD